MSRSRRMSPQGHVYVIHLATRYHHAGHYVGFATDLAQRIAQHRAGTGARLLEVIRQAGIEWKLVKVLPGDRTFERRLKRRKNTPRLCPVCRGEVAYDAVDEQDVLPGIGNPGAGGVPETPPSVPSGDGGDEPPF
jgi:predicted GIY-YIG superfamily endonuclease